LTIDAKFGDTRAKMGTTERLAQMVASAFGGLSEIGLWIVLFLLMVVGVTQTASYGEPAQPQHALAAVHCDDRSVQEFASTSLCWPGNTLAATA